MVIEGRVALVTGSARRVGRAIALSLGQAGAQIALHANRSVEEATQLAHEIRRLGRRCEVFIADLADADEAQRLVPRVIEAMGQVDVLVNNASVFQPDTAGGDDPYGFWLRTMSINAMAPAVLSAAVNESVSRRDASGAIVNIVDIAAERPWGGYGAYCASKAALLSLTRSCARAMAPRVRVNAVSPGVVLWAEQGGEDRPNRDTIIAKIPMLRVGSPEDVAKAVTFLVCRGAYITGQVLRVDGGRSINW